MRVVALSLLLAVSFQATAQDSACLKLYAEAHSDFQSNYEELALQERHMRGMAAVTLTASGICLYASRGSGVGIVGCGILGVMSSAPPLWSSASLSSRMQALYDAHLLFQAYQDYQTASGLSESGQILASDLGAEQTDLPMILQQLSVMMEEGALCERGEPVPYEDTLEMLNQRLLKN